MVRQHKQGHYLAVNEAQNRSSPSPNPPPTLHRMAVNLLEHLMSKLRYMHLEVTCTIGHFYSILAALTFATNRAIAYLGIIPP